MIRQAEAEGVLSKLIHITRAEVIARDSGGEGKGAWDEVTMSGIANGRTVRVIVRAEQ